MEGLDGRWLASYARFSKQYELKEEVAKSYMARRFVAGHAVKVIWKGSLDTLMTMSKREKAEVIPAARVEEFSKTAATAKPMVIKDSQGAILTLRITAPASYIRTLQETDRSLPARPPSPTNEEATSRLIMLCGRMCESSHPYLSEELLEDGEAA